MPNELRRLITMVAAYAFLGGSILAAEDTDIAAELDAIWAEISRSVSAGDFEAYAANYHSDAVLVHLGSASSEAIAAALANWKPGFDETRSGTKTAGVSFRFSQRLIGQTTAHETGIFHYWSRSADSELSESYVHFEALLVKKDGDWKLTMEYQKEPATEAEWTVLSPLD